MTRTASKPLIIDAAPAWGLTLAWEVSAKAGRGLASGLGRGGERVSLVELALEPTGGRAARAVLTAVLASGERAVMREAEGAALWRREAAHEHVDVPGVLSYTARRDAGVTPTYVRCPLLAQCGVPAGAYSLAVRG